VVGNTELEVNLAQAKVKANFKEVFVVGNFCSWNYNHAKKMELVDGKFQASISFHDTLKYQFLFRTDLWAYTPTGAKEYTFDDKGSYAANAFSENNKYTVVFDPNSMPTYQGTEAPESKYKVLSPELYSKYDEITSNFGSSKFLELIIYYNLFVKRENDDMIAFMPEEEIKNIAESHGKLYNEKADLLEKLIASTTDPALVDILMATKIIQKVAVDKATLDEIKPMIEKMNTIPAEQPAVLSYIMELREVQDNPAEMLTLLQEKIHNVSDKASQSVIEFNYLNEIGQKLNHEGEYSEFLLERYDMLLGKSELPEIYKPDIAEVMTKMKMKSSNSALDFGFTDFDGKKHKLADYRGKWVLLDFWATWCGPCRDEIPFIFKASKKFSNKELQIISVSHDQSIELAKAYAEKNGMNWVHTINLPDYCTASKLFNISSIPAPFLIDPDGKIVPVNDFQLRADNLELTLMKYLNREGA
jgi:thiol-disulfide isomerase/thioredoxin